MKREGLCHAGLRASRFALSAADIERNPAVFRCDICRALLPGPVWEPTLETFPFWCPTCAIHYKEAFCDICGLDLHSGRKTDAETRIARVPLTKPNGEIVGYALIDEDDCEFVSSFKWRLSDWGYAYASGGDKVKLLMHRMFLGLEKGDKREGDHINGDRLDNRRSNLRIATHSENCHNRSGYGGELPFRGVSVARWKSGTVRYRAEIVVNNRTIHLGFFDTPDEAAEAYSRFRAENVPFSPEAHSSGRRNESSRSRSRPEAISRVRGKT